MLDLLSSLQILTVDVIIRTKDRFIGIVGWALAPYLHEHKGDRLPLSASFGQR